MPRDGENLFRRGRLWYFKFRTPDGKFHEQSTACEKKPDARDVRDQKLALFRQGQMPTEMRRWTLQKAIDETLKIRAVQRPKSLRVQKTCLSRILKFFGPAKKLATFSHSDLEQYQIARSQTIGRFGKRISNRTINLELQYLISILKKAKLWGALADDYKPLPETESEIGLGLEPDQVLHLMRTALQRPEWLSTLCAAVLSACCTGMRGSEIKRLQLKNLLLDRSEPGINVPGHKTKTGRKGYYELNGLALWAVHKLVERAHLLGAHDPEHFLFPKNRSKHTRPDDPRRGQRGYDPTDHQTSWRTQWKSLTKAAGMPNLRFHDMRHTFVSESAASKVDLHVVQAIVGHMTPEMTKHYLHLRSRTKRLAVEALQERHADLAKLLGIPDKSTTVQ